MILYFAFLGVKANAVAELIELKLGTRVSPDECLQRFEFHRDVEFPNRNTSYTAEVIVGQECAKNVPVLDTFEAYTKIDAACEEILNKASLDVRDAQTTGADRRC